jgi:hypothetical protein
MVIEVIEDLVLLNILVIVVSYFTIGASPSKHYV